MFSNSCHYLVLNYGTFEVPYRHQFNTQALLKLNEHPSVEPSLQSGPCPFNTAGKSLIVLVCTAHFMTAWIHSIKNIPAARRCPLFKEFNSTHFIGCRGLSNKIQQWNSVGEDRRLSEFKGCCATCWKEIGEGDCLPVARSDVWVAGEVRALMKFVDVRVALVSLRLPGCRDAAMTDGTLARVAKDSWLFLLKVLWHINNRSINSH